MIHLLAIDYTAVIVAGIGAFVSLLSLLMTLLIKQKQNTIAAKVDGMTEKLITAEKDASRLGGKEEQRAETKADAVQAIKIEAQVTDDDAKKVAEVVVETVKADPEIEVKKIDKTKT